MIFRCLLLLLVALNNCSGCHWARKYVYMYSEGLGITCDRVQDTYMAEAGRTSVVVRWKKPRIRGGCGKLQQIGKAPGSSFGEGSHRITYIARNKFNKRVICHVKFKVQVKRCQTLRNPNGGSVTCTGNKYGDVCKYKCKKGHSLIGPSEVKCLKPGWWDRSSPTCKAKACSEPVPPPNALPFKCDKGSNYGSVCVLRCNSKNGFAAEKGQVTRCTDNGVWTEQKFGCKDIEPPIFINCPTQTIHQTADPEHNLTSVVWPKIKVKDNSGKVENMRATRGVTLTGGRFAPGTHIVKFKVADKAGNKADTCSFVVEVEYKQCEPPELEDEYLKTPGCVPPFKEGARCKAECTMDIKLVGSSYITCVASAGGQQTFWDWGQRKNPPSPKPHCLLPKCPGLPAPKHGAVACDRWQGGQMCQVMCQQGYDVPGEFEKYYICPINTGVWNNENVPPCQTAMPGWGQTLTAAYLYSGPCKKAEEEVRSKFIKMLTSNKLCQGQHCIVDNVKVTCGGDRKKRDLYETFGRVKRGSSVNYIVFELTFKAEIVAGVSSEYISNTTIARLGELLNDIKLNGKFEVAGSAIQCMALKQRTPLPLCKDGHVRGRHSKGSCVPCPIGTFFNASKSCQVCAVGSYQDQAGSMACVGCPSGYTTLTKARTNKSDCKALCKPGSYSKTSVSPCTSCPKGTFQPHEGATSCVECPRGMRTKAGGAKFHLDCIPYDVLFQGPVSVSMSSASHVDVCEFTLSIWVKVVSPSKDGLKLEVYHPRHGKTISMELGRHINVVVAKDKIRVKRGLEQKWSHVALTWSRSSIHLFNDGVQVHHRKRQCTRCPLPGEASMTIHLERNVFALVQSLNVMPEANLQLAANLSKSCEAVMDHSLFSINGLSIDKLDRVLEVTPSTCLQNNACKARPCGHHYCVPTKSTYRCVCKGGYSGDNCEVTPDFCKETECASGSTCQSTVDGYKCICPVNVTGMLCDDNQVPPEWSEWSDWDECSKSCGSGVKMRHRFCNHDDEEGRQSCPGNDTQTGQCHLATCPECKESDLIAGKGTKVSCITSSENTTCSVGCKNGLVFSDEPDTHICIKGEWTPGLLTQSCTVPQTPFTVGIKYSVLLQTEVSVNSAKKDLLHIGSSFSCVKEGTCRHHVEVTGCHDDKDMCKQYRGGGVAHLKVIKDIEPGTINLTDALQTKHAGDFNPLFNTWETLRFESTKSASTEDSDKPDRDLQIQVQGSQSLIFPKGNRSVATRVDGELGKIMSAWNDLDTANKEVSKNNYSVFSVRMPGQKAPYMVAEQDVTCPEGSIPGGMFCVKCAPGTYFTDHVCLSCPTGFYQDQEGQLECQPCPGFSSTSLVGASSSVSCRAPVRSNQYLVLSSGLNKLTKINTASMEQESLSLPVKAGGKVGLHVHNPTDGYIYYTTTSPVTICRLRWDGTDHTVLTALNADKVTGLVMDERSNILFFTLHGGSLRALTFELETDVLLLENLNKPRDLVIDQENYLMYWSEGNEIMQYKFGCKTRSPLLKHKTAIWGLQLEKDANKLWWFARGKIYSTNTEHIGIEKVMQKGSVHFGQIEDYLVYVDNEKRLIRVNADGESKVNLLQLTEETNHMSRTSPEQRQWRNLICQHEESECRGTCWQTGPLTSRCLK